MNKLMKQKKMLLAYKPSNKSKKNGNGGDKILNQSTINRLTQTPIYKLRQVYYPSATAFTVSGTGASYTAATGLLISGSADCLWSLYFRATDLPQFAGTLTGVWDQYKIALVRVHMINQSKNSFSGQNNSPHYSAIDFDDSTVPANIAAIQQYQAVKIVPPNQSVTTEIYPRLALDSGSGFVNQNAGWVDCADGTVQHYGLKGVIPIQTTAVRFNFVVEMEIQFRSIR